MNHFKHYVFILIILSSCNQEKINNSESILIEDKLNKEKSADTINSEISIDRIFALNDTMNIYGITKGFFNSDTIIDNAMILKNKKTNNLSLLIIYGQGSKFSFFQSGKEFGADFDDLNWIGYVKHMPKGSEIAPNVMNGEIVSDDKISDTLKIILENDAILLHVSEGCGGGFVFYQNSKFNWVQQD